MKKILVSIVSLLLFSNIALAVSHDEQVDLDLEAAALVQIAQGDVELPQDRSFLGLDLTNPFGFITKLKDQVQGIKDTLLASFDENGNGKIDPGTEFENFKVGVKSIIMLVADSNQNGKIDPEDIVALSKLALTKVQEQTLTKVCPSVYKQVELSGKLIVLRPVLAKINELCLAHDAANTNAG